MRQARLLIPGAAYHVITRANRKEKLLASPLAKDPARSRLHGPTTPSSGRSRITAFWIIIRSLVGDMRTIRSLLRFILQVQAKTPHIDAKITGTGADISVEALKRSITGLKVSADDEAIPINDDPWFQKLPKSRTAWEVLWCCRGNAKFTLDELAGKSGIAKYHLWEMENNKRPIGVKTAKKLVVTLKCDFHRLLVE